MPEMRAPQLPPRFSAPVTFSVARQQVPSFAEIANRAQNNGGPAVVSISFIR